jgi:hypothetical protein
MAGVKRKARRKNASGPSETTAAVLDIAPPLAPSAVHAMEREELNSLHRKMCSLQYPECSGTYTMNNFRVHVASLVSKKHSNT